MKTGLCLAAALGLALSATGALAQSNRVMVYLNGDRIDFGNVKPRKARGGAMIPLRPIVEKMGGDVRWDAATDTAWVSLPNDFFTRIHPGQPFVQVNGRNIPLAATPTILNGHIMMPTQFFHKVFETDTMENVETGTVRLVSHTVLDDRQRSSIGSPASDRIETRRTDFNRDADYDRFLRERDYYRYRSDRAAWERDYQDYLEYRRMRDRNPALSSYDEYLQQRDFELYQRDRDAWRTNYQEYLRQQNQRPASPRNASDWNNYYRDRDTVLRDYQRNQGERTTTTSR